MKNLPKLKNIVVLGKFEDDGIRQFIVDEKTQHVILAAMKGINGGIIKVGEDAIEGITWKSNIDLNLK